MLVEEARDVGEGFRFGAHNGLKSDIAPLTATSV
jgi:hypothetical protein